MSAIVNTKECPVDKSEAIHVRIRDGAVKRILDHAGLVAGSGALFLILAAAVFAPFLTSHDPYQQDLSVRLLNPVWYTDGTWENPLGTDYFGRDYLTRLLFGARVSLFVGTATIVISGFIGTVLGVVGGYFGGKTDAVVMFIITTRLSLPVALVATAASALTGSTLLMVVLILGLLLWDRFAIVARGATQQIRSHDYIRSAQAVGCSTSLIFIREILPNLVPILFVVATLELAHAILLEAALSFLGVGVPPPLPSWGLMIAEGKTQMLFKPWVIGIPGTVLFVLILAINLVGDGLRDVASPDSQN